MPPGIEIVKIFLDDDIGTARIRRAADKTEKVARIEIPKSGNLIDNRHRRAETC
jgi:hypothetical protein